MPISDEVQSAMKLLQSLDWPAWIEALATAVTALIALYLLGREQVDRRERGQDRVAEQARRVSMSKVRFYYHGQSQDRPVGTWDLGLSTEVKNRSTEVVTILSVTFVATENPFRGDQRSETGVRLNVRLDPDEEKIVMGTVLLEVDPATINELVSEFQLTSSILFVDAAGRYWRRDYDHRLQRVRIGALDRIRLAIKEWFGYQ